jgi:CoA:oxalate CoA-transferase
MNQHTGALDGLRVIGLTHLGAGPYALSLLGDLGADVINIEPPGGDSLRGRDAAFEVMSSYFLSINRSKRDVVLDLKHPDGLEAARRLIAGADVLVENYRVGALDRLGLGYEAMSELNPRLVYVSITPWGLQGPMQQDIGMDLLAQARSGMMGLNGEPGRRPVRVPPPIADFVSAYLAAFGIMCGLRSVEQLGVGQRVETSLLAGQVASLANLITYFARTGEPSQPLGSAHPQLVPCAPFRTADGYIVLACITEGMWRKLCLAIGAPELIDDPRFSRNIDRTKNVDALTQLLEERLGEEPSAHWAEILRAADVPVGPISSLSDLINDPQVIANDYIRDIEHPVVGKLKVPGFPVSFSRTPARESRPAALLGEHTTEVLTELGYSAEQIERMLASGAARSSS